MSALCTTAARCVPQDYGEAAKWYRLAAEQGDAIAQGNLGFMYYSGQGVPQDYVQAYMWVDLAASRFPAKEDRDAAANNRNIVASKMTREQLAEAKRPLLAWKMLPRSNCKSANYPAYCAGSFGCGTTQIVPSRY